MKKSADLTCKRFLAGALLALLLFVPTLSFADNEIILDSGSLVVTETSMTFAGIVTQPTLDNMIGAGTGVVLMYGTDQSNLDHVGGTLYPHNSQGNFQSISDQGDFSIPVTGLTANTTYYYDMRSSADYTTSYLGGTRTFQTPAAGGNDGAGNSGAGQNSGTNSSTTPETPYVAGGLVPCGGTSDSPCDFTALLKLINNVINFLLFDISLPICAVVFMYAGWLFMTSGDNSTKKSQAKSVFWHVLFGWAIALASWLIVHTILVALGYDGSWIGL